VQVVHRPDGKENQPFNLRSDTLTAELEPDPNRPAGNQTPAGEPAANSGAGGGVIGGSGDPVRLKRVIASGNVEVKSARANLEAGDLAFDPVAQVLTARGDQGNPVTMFDNVTGSTTQAGEVQWNTRTDQFQVKELRGKVRR
jgi:hypothetical protein